MKIVIPTFIFEGSNKLDQLKMLLSLIHSYYYYNNDLDIVVFTNSTFIREKVLEFGKSYDSKISVDFKELIDIKDDMGSAYDFFNRVNHNKLLYSINVNLIYHYCFLNYRDTVILDNDMLFLKKVDFKNIIKNNNKVHMFHNYSKVGDWSVNDFFKDEYKTDIELHGGTWYIPSDINLKSHFNDYTNTIEDKIIEDRTNLFVTDELFMVHLYQNDMLELHKGDINSYNVVENDNVSLLHFLHKPTKLIVNRNKEVQIKTKPIDSYNYNTFKYFHISNFMMFGYLHWLKHVCYVNETLNDYFRDYQYVGSCFFEEVLKAIKKP